MKKNAVFIISGICLIFLLYAGLGLLIPLPFGSKALEFEIRKGMSFRQVVDALAEKGFVRDKHIFSTLGRIAGIDRRVRAGYYNLWGNMTPWQIFNALKAGEIVEFEITVLPGDSLLEIAERFSYLGLEETDNFLSICRDRDLLDSLGIDAPSVEGYLFPDTYIFPKGLKTKELLSIMVGMMRKKYDGDMMARTQELGLDEKTVLTIASIVEKEAVIDDERPIIAAVYHNRLKKKMPLQADPTAIYGIKRSKEKITREDLLRKTGYNTYVIKGLPPGPIASPGLSSIKAALYPADVPYIFFVSNNDGTHKFSVTIDDHSKAVKEYRDKRKVSNTKQ